MAARPQRGLIRRALGWLGKALAGLAALSGLFFLAGWIGSSIPRNAMAQPATDGVTIMVETNGVHTGIVMPIVSEYKDWRETFPSSRNRRPDGQLPTHISVGWGEREIFLGVPTWGDLKPSTALRIGLTGGDAVMRVSHYVRPAPSESHRPLVLSPDQYVRLVSLIERTLPPEQTHGTDLPILRGTDPRDAYYEALGRWTIGRTCNSWVGNTLAMSGVRMGWWTPFAGGVMKWVPYEDR